MKILKINSLSDFDLLCDQISPEITGRKIMQKKSKLNFFYLKDIKAPAANILKQDALSVGAEFVTHRDTILGRGVNNGLLIANDKQIEILSKKEAAQDFELKDLAKFLKSKFIKPAKPLIMGVVNINEDSFNRASRVDLSSGIAKIEQMIEEGADFIDLGGVSSRPGSRYCGREEEFLRISGIIGEIYRLNLHEKVSFSLDSFDEYCLEFALNHGFAMINDISAKISLCELAKRYDAWYCLMHMQGNPENMQINPSYDDILLDIDEFFALNLAKIEEIGVKKITLDVGIGFGKSAEQNLLLIKHLGHFLHFGYPLFIGASRKSVIDFYSPSPVEDRLSGSLYLHLKSYENGATFIRTHDVKEHKQMFDMHLAMENLGV